MPKIALIDGDTVAYRCAASTCRTWYYVGGEEFKYKKEARQYCEDVLGMPKYKKGKPDPHASVIEPQVQVEPFGITKYNIDQMMMRILGDTGAEDYEVWLSGDGNYRYEIAVTSPYKGTRDRSATPSNLEETHRYLVSDYGAAYVDGCEADDILGIQQTAAGDNSVIATNDKDLRMIPGWHYNINKQEMDYVNADEAIRFFYYQLLVGDTSDNIQGIKGCGDVTANALLRRGSTEEEWLAIVYDKYCSVYGDDAMDRLTEFGALLWIQREEGVIWTPNVDG